MTPPKTENKLMFVLVVVMVPGRLKKTGNELMFVLVVDAAG